jgi:hypothetical protein
MGRDVSQRVRKKPGSRPVLGVRQQAAADVIELVDLKLRGGDDAPAAAARAAQIAERWVSRDASHDVMAVVSEIVAWFARTGVVPNTMKLEIAVTSSTVLIRVTATGRFRARAAVQQEELGDVLPVTAARATRAGIAGGHKPQIWAEFERVANVVAAD